MTSAPMTRFFAAISLLQATLLLCPDNIQAAAPPLLPVQGYLTDAEDTPLDGSYQLRFALFDAPSAGSVVFTTTSSVNVKRGRFVSYLGETDPLQLDKVHEANGLWLEVTIVAACADATCERPSAINRTLSPRIRLASAPFAASASICTTAENARTLDGLSAAELQSKASDVQCQPNEFISSVRNGSPVCSPAPQSATQSAQSILPDVTCSDGQLLAGIQGGKPVCVPRPKDGTNGSDGQGLVFDEESVLLTFAAPSSPDGTSKPSARPHAFCALSYVDIAQGVGARSASSFCYVKGSRGNVWTLNVRSAGEGQTVTCSMSCF